MKHEIVQEGVNVSPPVVITGWAWMYGLTLTDLVALATLAYIILQAGYLLWKWIQEVKGQRK